MDGEERSSAEWSRRREGGVTERDAVRARRRTGGGGPSTLAIALGVLLILASLVVLALMASPALRASVPAIGTGAAALVALATAGVVLSLLLTGISVVALAAAVRRHASAMDALDRLDERFASYLRADEVPEEMRSGAFMNDIRERDARYVALESVVTEVPRLRSQIDDLGERVRRASVSLFDPVTGERVSVPINMESRGRGVPADAPVDALEGVGPDHAEALQRAGYRRAGDLRRDDARIVADRTGIDQGLVRRWQAMVASEQAGRADSRERPERAERGGASGGPGRSEGAEVPESPERAEGRRTGTPRA